jgi:putative transposase
VASIGGGRAPTRCWARPGSGGKKTGKDPTDRGKKGTKKSVLVDGQGGPLGVTLAGANVLERKMLRETIEAIVVERPEPTAEDPQDLSLDGGYKNPTGRAAATEAGYIPHIHVGGEVVKPADRKPGYKPRRWVVERTLAWLSKCRGILVRYDKKDTNYLGLIELACALYWYRRLVRLSEADASQDTT